MSHKAISNRLVFVPVLLIIGGFLGNYFTIPLFFGADFLFGSIAVLLVLYFYGLTWGLLAAVIIHAYTFILWGHPYGFVNFICEALFVGVFLHRGRRNIVALDGLFWLLIGMPLAFVEHGFIMHMDITTTFFIMLKQSVNGVFNALLASLIVCYLPMNKLLRRHDPTPRISFQTSLFNLFVTMVLFPALFLMMLQVRYEKQTLETEVKADLQSLSAHVKSSTHSWFQMHLRAVNQLAELAGQPSTTLAQLQRNTEILNRSFPDFRTMHVENAQGHTIVFSPLINERGTSNLGLDFSGRSWFQKVKTDQKPYVSEVFVGQLAVLSPIVNVCVPVMRENHWFGISTGTLDLTRVQEMLQSYRFNRVAVITLIDNQGRIIVSTASDRKPTELWNRTKTGISQPLGASMYLWLPVDKRLPSMSRWQQSFYVQETVLEPELPWKLIAESPVAPLQLILYTIYVRNLAVMACLIALALLFSHVFSRGLTQPLSRLAQITTRWSEKLNSTKDIDWPASSTLEIDSLIDNFRSMTGALASNLGELRSKSDELGQINRDLNKEIREKQQTAEALQSSEKEAKRLSQENEIIAQIGQIISSTLNIDEVYEKFAEKVSMLIPADRISIARINHGEDTSIMAYVSGTAVPGRAKGDVFPLSGTATERVVQTRSGIIIHMGDKEMVQTQFPALICDFDAGIRSRIVLPLISRDEVIGTFHVCSLKCDVYTDRDLQIAENIASQIAGAVVNAQLYTEIQQAEEAIQISEEKYRIVVENSLVGFSIIQDGVFQFVNKRFCDIYGYSKEEIEHVMDTLHFIHPDDKKKIEESIGKRLNGDIRHIEFEFRAIRKDGKLITVKILGSSIIYNGRPAAAGSIIDVTSEKVLETQFFQAQKMEAVGVLAGGIAHDFNNILMTVLGYTSLMLMDTNPQDRNYEKLEIIEKQMQSAADLTKQLLGFARGGKYEIKSTGLNELLSKSVDMFGRTKKEISTLCTFDEGLWNVEVDRGQMEQVFLNLFVNAWQAMPGGGKLYIETRNAVFDETPDHVVSSKQGKYVKISITDTGIGMDEATRERVFEPFFTTQTMGRGTGLGLATVYGIIKNHGGVIDVYSETGKGTTFNVYLPASEEVVKEDHRELCSVQKGTETILLVDDQDAVLGVGKAMLETLGYMVLPAGSGEEAIDLYKENTGKIDLVILDMIMPGMSGAETYTVLREMNLRVKVLLSSGYSMNDQALSIMKQGCNGFIQKPFNVSNLSKKVREVLVEDNHEHREGREGDAQV
jgi:two-component system cell cycle sensor histidine kinase/response regulator CckA